MSREKVLELVKSDEKQEVVIAKLTKLFKDNPSLLNSYDLDGSVFHLFVQHGRYAVLKHFLEDPKYSSYALKVDRNNDTIMHYAVKNPQDPQTTGILQLLIKKIPEQINLTNSSGNTPLHQAVSSNQQWAIVELIKNGADKTVSNRENRTAFGLAGDKDALRKALMYLDLRDVGALQLGEKGKTPSRQEFYNQFPSLTRTNTPSSLASVGSSVNSSASSSPMSSARDLLPSPTTEKDNLLLSSRLVSWSTAIRQTKSRPEEQNNIAELDPNSLFVRLLEAYVGNLPSFEALKHQFCVLAKTQDLAVVIDVKNILFKLPKNKPALYSTLGNIYPLVQEEYKKFQSKTEQFMSNFVAILVKEGLLQDSNSLKKPDFETLFPGRSQAAELFWTLTSGMMDGTSTRKYVIQDIIHTAIGLQAKYSFVETIDILSELYTHFDKNQKLITHYIICQLIYYNYQEVANETSPLSMRLMAFIEPNLNAHANANPRGSLGLGQLRDELRAGLKTLISDIRAFNNNLLIKNYRLLIAWYQPVYSEKSSISFEDLVYTTLKKEGKEREELIGVIADELRTRTKAFYQQVPLHEFYNKKWSEKGYEINAPYITANTVYFNKLNNFLTKLILFQTEDNILNVLQFMVQLLVALCPLENDSYPDLQHVMLIASVLSRTPVSRLAKYFNALSPQDKKTIEEINKLVSNEQNSVWMRETLKCRSTALPFLGGLQTDLTFALESGSELTKAATSGKILLDIIKVSALVAFEIPHNQTNLSHFVANIFEEVSEKVLYIASYRAFPKKIAMTRYKHDLDALCTEVDNTSLQNNQLPLIIEEAKENPALEVKYSMYDFLKKIVELYELKINSTISGLIEEQNKPILPTAPNTNDLKGIQKNNSGSVKDSKEAGTSSIQKTNSSSSKECKESVSSIQKTHSSSSKDSASSIQKNSSGTPRETSEPIPAQKSSPRTAAEIKDKESNPSAYYRRNYDWKKEFPHVDPKDIENKITILHDSLKILARTITKSIHVHNNAPLTSPTAFKINPVPFLTKLKSLTLLIDNLKRPPLERLRKMSVLSAQPGEIKGFNTSFRAQKAVSIDPTIAPDTSSSLSSEGSKFLSQTPQQISFPGEKKSQKDEKNDQQDAPVKSRRKSKEPKDSVIKRKGSVRGTFSQLTLFKEIPTSDTRSESPARPTIVPPKSEPVSGSVIVKR